MVIKQSVIDFINNFRDQSEVFLNKADYWFAVILYQRFVDSQIFYCRENDSFIVKIGEHLFNINGDVTDNYRNRKLLPWRSHNAIEEDLFNDIDKRKIKLRRN